MAFDLKEGKIMLFPNANPGQDAKKPLITGKAKVDGLDVKVAVWRGKESNFVGKLSLKEGGTFSLVGTLDYKTTEKKGNGPDSKGKLILRNKPYEISLWNKSGPKGKYLSGALQDPTKAKVIPLSSKPAVTSGSEDIF